MRIAAAVILLAVATRVIAAESRGDAAPAQPSAPSAAESPTTDADSWYEAGRQLYEAYAPDEVKQQFAFPTREKWATVAAQLQGALQGDSLGDLAAYAPQARAALGMMKTLGVDSEEAGWLEQRLDELEAAQQAEAQPPRPARAPGSARPSSPAPPVTPKPREGPAGPAIPYYDLWLSRVRSRPVPDAAAGLMPTLRSAFAAEGVPPALAWVAEAESSLDPNARSPSGAKGLFQLTPDTARNLGLATFLPDERTDPEKSARAAAKYLRDLHGRFGSWPLALAAYNAGEGRVGRAVAARHAKDFAAIADALPAETRMYVPKVCALVQVRTGTALPGL